MKPSTSVARLFTVALLLASSTASCFGTQSGLSKLAKSPVSSRFGLTIRGGSTVGGENSEVPPPAGSGDVELGVNSPVPEITPPPPAAVEPTPANALMGPKASPPGLMRRAFPKLPWHRLPNILTYVRCLAIPALMVVFDFPNRHIETSAMFAIASFTDWLDGYLARRWDITSSFGAFLDPVADKLMVSTALILLAGRYGTPVAIPAAFILAREIAVSALREWMAQRGQRDAVKVGFQGKVKTALTMVALTVLLLVPVGNKESVLSKLYQPGVIMLDLCALVTITSGSVYFRAAAPVLMGKD